jgi:hypothetical protein
MRETNVSNEAKGWACMPNRQRRHIAGAHRRPVAASPVAGARRLVAERFGCNDAEAELMMVRYSSAVDCRPAIVAQDLLAGRNRGVILDSIRDAI